MISKGCERMIYLGKEALHLLNEKVSTTLPPCESEAVPLRLNARRINVFSDNHNRLLCVALT